MKMFFSFFLLALLNTSFSQEKLVAKAKATAMDKIIEVLLKDDTCLFKAFIVADFSYKPIDATKGIIAFMKISDTIVADLDAEAFLDTMIRDRKYKSNIFFSSFHAMKYTNRFNAINFFSELYASSYSKEKFIYIEINSPIEGWGWCDVLLADSIYSGYEYMSLQSDVINVPVFLYTSDNNVDNKSLFLFRYKMVFKNRVFSLEYLGNQLIG